MGEEEQVGALNAPVKDTQAISIPLPVAVSKPELAIPVPISSIERIEPSEPADAATYPANAARPANPAMSNKDTPVATQPDWNTSKLGLRVGVDALSAGAAGALVAPIITMIDKGIIENASGRNSLGDSLKQSARELLLRPHRFIGSKPFALIFVRPRV